MAKRVQVIPLKCPECGNRLLGLEQDKVFFCAPCRKGYELLGGEFNPRPLHFARPVIEYPRVPVIFLPFYRFQVEFIAESKDPRQVEAARRYKDLDTIWVMGYNFARASYFGDTGFLYTESRAQIEEETDTYGRSERFRLAGCARTVAEAKGYIKLFLLLMIDKRRDITGMELSPLIHETSIWGIPFYDFQDKLKDAIRGKEIPAFATDDIEALRKI
jgi:hypothetical protein